MGGVAAFFPRSGMGSWPRVRMVDPILLNRFSPKCSSHLGSFAKPATSSRTNGAELRWVESLNQASSSGCVCELWPHHQGALLYVRCTWVCASHPTAPTGRVCCQTAARLFALLHFVALHADDLSSNRYNIHHTSATAAILAYGHLFLLQASAIVANQPSSAFSPVTSV
jgi:hypothetical protein